MEAYPPPANGTEHGLAIALLAFGCAVAYLLWRYSKRV